ncbi:hypothetical protein [Kitasatospora griseola]|uniref:hypothetical protein n=1 Tax=Kitasatospora griseola TaxID=2064 RepID=UPI00380D12FE
MSDRYTITREPAAPESWWASNKLFVVGGACLLVGFWLAGGCGSGTGSNVVAPTAPASSTSPPAAATAGT